MMTGKTIALTRWTFVGIVMSLLFNMLSEHVKAMTGHSFFSKESVLRIRWPKYWGFIFNISPSNEYLGLLFFKLGWLDLLVVQGTLMSLLQYHSSKESITQLSAFLIVQLSHPYMPTGKTIALIRWTFVGIVMSLLFNMLSR